MDENDVPFLYIGIFVTSFVTIVGGLSNLLTIATLIHQKCLPRLQRSILWSANTVLIFNLALADLSYCCVSLPFVTVTYIKVLINRTVDPFTNEQCVFPAFWRYSTAIVEWTTLGVIALERCVNLSKYVNSKYFTAKKMLLASALIWILGIVLQVPVLSGGFTGYEFGYNNETYKCDFIKSNETRNDRMTPRLTFFAVYLSIPLSLIICCYSFIIYQVCASSNLLERHGTHQNRSEASTRKSRTTTIIIGIISVFLVAVLPMSLWNIIQEAKGWENDSIEVGISLYCLYWLQYCVNSIIYAISSVKFRRAYVQFLQLITCRKVERVNRLVYATHMSRASSLQCPTRRTESSSIDLPRELDSPAIISKNTLMSRTQRILTISEAMDNNYDLLKPRSSMESIYLKPSSLCTSTSLISFKPIGE